MWLKCSTEQPISEAEEIVLNVLPSTLVLSFNQIVKTSFSCFPFCYCMVSQNAAAVFHGIHSDTDLIAAYKHMHFIVCLWLLGGYLSRSSGQLALFSAVTFSFLFTPVLHLVMIVVDS